MFINRLHILMFILLSWVFKYFFEMKIKEIYLDKNLLFISNRVKYNKQNNIKYDYELDLFVYEMYYIYESKYKLKEINLLYQIHKPNFNLGRAYWLQLWLNRLVLFVTFRKWKKPRKKIELINSIRKFKKDFVSILTSYKVRSSS